MAMSQLQVLDVIVRPVLADSLGMTKQEERDVWLTCYLIDLRATEVEDFQDLAWRLNRKFQERGMGVTVNAQDLEGQRKTVADVVKLICRKLDEVEVPASEVVENA